MNEIKNLPKKEIISEIISSVITLLFVLAVIFGIAYAYRSVTRASAPDPMPEKMVSALYQEWSNYPGNPMVDKIYHQSPYFTSDLVARLDEDSNTFPNGIGFDPILCSQEIPLDFSVDLTMDRDTANVKVIENFEKGSEEINVTLVKVGSQWKVDKIICGK